MAENKKSFILYSDFKEVFNELSDQDAGQLIKHIFKYVNDENPETENPIVKISFIPIKLSLKRDLKKWDKYIKRQRDNGKKGGRPTANPNEASLTQQNPLLTQKTQALIEKPKKADSVSVSVSVNDSVSAAEEVGSDKVSELANEAWKSQHWRDSLCMGLTLTTGELKKWLALFNSSISSDKVPGFDLGKYKKMSRGWISKQISYGNTVDNGMPKNSGSPPLQRLN